MSAATTLTFRQVLAISDFRKLWIAHTISMFGDFLALFAILNVASFHMQANASELTWITISYMLPGALVGPIIGVFVDRWPLKTTLIGSDVARAALAVGFLFATKMWHFYAATAAIAVVGTFFLPAQGVGIRTVVPREGQFSASVLMQQVVYVMRIAGPGLAGLIVSSFGPRVCYLVDTSSFLVSAAILTTVSLTPRTTAERSPDEATGVRRVWLDLRAGFDFLLHHGPLLFVVLSLASGIFAVGCFGPLIAVHVRDNLHGGTGIFSIASALIGVGIFVGITFLRGLMTRFSHSQLVSSGLGGMAVFIAMLGIASSIPVTLAACFFTGVCVSGVIIPAQTLLQTETPPHLLGRVGSTVISTVFGAQIIGLILSGELARITSIRQVFGLTAITLLVLLAAGRLLLAHRTGTMTYPDSTVPKT